VTAAVTAPSEPEIRFDHVSKAFGRTGSGRDSFLAVDDLSLDIARSEIVALLGKTGCGKSTMFNMIAGLLEPTHGNVRVCGRDPFKEFDWFRGKLAIVFQNDRLLPWRTALANVELGLQILDVAPAERRERAMHWLGRLGLGGHENDYPHALSGGMRQRVSIARAFATNAELLLCDEPFSALDEMTAQRLRQEFVGLVRENEKTAVFITHSINEALQIGDRIVVLTRPARIALDVRPDGNGAGGNGEAIRASILDVLSA
jgi:ABC-type nitrate/sulfonate/bicarbonate transport system ATPase subunit